MKAIKKRSIIDRHTNFGIRIPKNNKGIAIIEMALMLTTIIFLIFGIIYLGQWGDVNFDSIIKARNSRILFFLQKTLKGEKLDFFTDIKGLFSPGKQRKSSDVSLNTPTGKYLNRSKLLKKEYHGFFTKSMVVELRDGSLRGFAVSAKRGKGYYSSILPAFKIHNFYMESNVWRYRLGILPPSIMNSLTRLYHSSDASSGSVSAIKIFSFWRAMDLFNEFLEKTGADILENQGQKYLEKINSERDERLKGQSHEASENF